VDDHALVRHRTAGNVHGLRRAVSLLALLPFVATAQDDSAVIEWRHESTAEVAGFRIYYGRDPRSLSGMQQVLDPAARMTSVDGLADGTWYFEVRAVSTSAVESEASSLTCVVIPSGSCDVPLDAQSRTRNPAVTADPTPEIRVDQQRRSEKLRIPLLDRGQRIGDDRACREAALRLVPSRCSDHAEPGRQGR
jgi:hypothetical protein